MYSTAMVRCITGRHLQRLLAVVAAAEHVYEVAPDRPPASEGPARRVFDALAAGRFQPVMPPERASLVPGSRHVSVALDSAKAAGGPVAVAADAIDAVASTVAWRARPDGEHHSAEFMRGHADARILRSVDADGQVVVGLSVLAPRTMYPDHSHPPEEVYVVLSPGEWRGAGGEWVEPGVGGIVHTRAGVTHSMRAAGDPLLAVWFHVDTPFGGSDSRRVASN